MISHPFPEITDGTAIFSKDRQYRYLLTRGWSVHSRATCMFCCLNPSKADGQKDDATVRRMMRFAHSWGYARMIVVNLFAFIATDPRELALCQAPVGAVNDDVIRDAVKDSMIVVAGWGANAGKNSPFESRAREVEYLIRHDMKRPIHCLGTTGCGEPKHPLRLSASLTPQLWRFATVTYNPGSYRY